MGQLMSIGLGDEVSRLARHAERGQEWEQLSSVGTGSPLPLLPISWEGGTCAFVYATVIQLKRIVKASDIES